MVTTTLTRTLNAQEIVTPGAGSPFDFGDPANFNTDFNFVSIGCESIEFTEQVATQPGEANYDAELA